MGMLRVYVPVLLSSSVGSTGRVALQSTESRSASNTDVSGARDGSKLRANDHEKFRIAQSRDASRA